MNLSAKFSISLLFALLSHVMFAQESLNEVIERGLSVSRAQSIQMAQALEDKPTELPRSYQQGKFITSDYRWWCSGFFPGVLWQLYADAPSNQLLRYAELYTDRVEPVKHMTDTHDLGFMLYCSFGQGFRVTGNPRYLEIIHEGTVSAMNGTRATPGMAMGRLFILISTIVWLFSLC